MSKAIKFDQIHRLVKDKKIYLINGSGIRLKTEANIAELVITREPYNKPLDHFDECFWLEGELSFIGHKGIFATSEFTRKISLGDYGIKRDGAVYNLNRLFFTYEDALEFIAELNSRVFSDPIDQQQCDKRVI